jgi:sugar phosphate isomerase/epimerase
MARIVIAEPTFKALRAAYIVGLPAASEFLKKIDGFEIWCSPLIKRRWFTRDWQIRLDEVERFLERAEKGIYKHASTFHGIFDFHPLYRDYRINWCQAKDLELKKKILRVQIRLIHLLNFKGLKPALLILHPGHYQHPSEHRSALGFISRLLKETAPYALKKGVKLLMENVFNYGESSKIQLGANLEDELEIIEHLQGTVGLCFDLSHAILAALAKGEGLAGALDLARKARPFVEHLHLTFPDRSFVEQSLSGWEPRSPRLYDIDGHSSFTSLPTEIQKPIDSILQELLQNTQIDRVCLEHCWPRRLWSKAGCSLRELEQDLNHVRSFLSKNQSPRPQ